MIYSEALTIFMSVAEHESFAETARQLNRSPAAVTRAVTALEDHLQSRLFNRTTRSVSLTGAGTRYLESCRRFLAAYGELEAVNLRERVAPRGVINHRAPNVRPAARPSPHAKLPRQLHAGGCPASPGR